MRVLFVSPYPPERDGIGAYSKTLRTEIADRGHDVRVIAARGPTNGHPEVCGALPGAWVPWRFPDLDNLDADVVHVQFAVAAYGVRVFALLRILSAAKATGAPLVITMHEVTRDTDSLRTAGVALYRKVAGLADHLIVHTQAAHDRLLNAAIVGANERVSVVPIPVPRLVPSGRANELRERYGLGVGDVLLSFGFIDPDKGLEDLVEAMALLRRENRLPATRVVVAGTVRRRFGIMRIFEVRGHLHLRRLRKAAAEHGVSETIRFIGFVPDEDVTAWFDLARAAVLPYRRIEESAVARLAEATGTPMLTTDVGELGSLSVVEPAAPQDPAALAETIKRFLGLPDAAPGGKPQQRDLAAIADRTISIYERAAGDAVDPSGGPT